MQILVHVDVVLHRGFLNLHMAFLKAQKSILEDAVDPSYFNFFLET
jgi:hypothetical protein